MNPLFIILCMWPVAVTYHIFDCNREGDISLGRSLMQRLLGALHCHWITVTQAPHFAVGTYIMMFIPAVILSGPFIGTLYVFYG